MGVDAAGDDARRKELAQKLKAARSRDILAFIDAEDEEQVRKLQKYDESRTAVEAAAAAYTAEGSSQAVSEAYKSALKALQIAQKAIAAAYADLKVVVSKRALWLQEQVQLASKEKQPFFEGQSPVLISLTLPYVYPTLALGQG